MSTLNEVTASLKDNQDASEKADKEQVVTIRSLIESNEMTTASINALIKTNMQGHSDIKNAIGDLLTVMTGNELQDKENKHEQDAKDERFIDLLEELIGVNKEKFDLSETLGPWLAGALGLALLAENFDKISDKLDELGIGIDNTIGMFVSTVTAINLFLAKFKNLEGFVAWMKTFKLPKMPDMPKWKSKFKLPPLPKLPALPKMPAFMESWKLPKLPAMPKVDAAVAKTMESINKATESFKAGWAKVADTLRNATESIKAWTAKVRGPGPGSPASAGGPLTRLSNWLKKATGIFGRIATLFKVKIFFWSNKLLATVNKWLTPIIWIVGIYQSINAWMESKMKSDSDFDAFVAVAKVLWNLLLEWPISMLNKGIAWVLEKMGLIDEGFKNEMGKQKFDADTVIDTLKKALDNAMDSMMGGLIDMVAAYLMNVETLTLGGIAAENMLPDEGFLAGQIRARILEKKKGKAPPEDLDAGEESETGAAPGDLGYKEPPIAFKDYVNGLPGSEKYENDLPRLNFVESRPMIDSSDINKKSQAKEIFNASGGFNIVRGGDTSSTNVSNDNSVTIVKQPSAQPVVIKPNGGARFAEKMKTLKGNQ